MSKRIFLAADTGKSSCRLISGHFDGRKLSIATEGRFDLYQACLPDGWYYLDIVNVFSQLKDLLARYSAAHGDAASIGFDTWGGDYGLLDKNNTLLGLPLFFKNTRFADHFDEFLKTVDMREVFFRTGMDAAPYNSPVRLFIQKKLGHTDLKNADRFVGLADLLSFFFSGRPVSELTSISVTRMVDLATNQYSRWLLDELGVDSSILKNEIVMPGTVIGNVLPQVGEEIHIPGLQIVAAPGHDTTASALATPEMDENTIFMGSGTTMVYCSVNRKLTITDDMYRFNTSIVKGFGNTDIMVKNFNAGMWLMHALRRDWVGGVTYEQMYDLAERAEPFRMCIDIDSTFFESWGNVKQSIAQYCRRTGQQVLEDDAQFVRCLVESYALKARWCLDSYERILGRPIKKLAIVGGGVYARFFCQQMADATGRYVIAGAAEATSIGNILSQMYALGEVSSEEQMRQIVNDSFGVTVYEPTQDRAPWDEAYGRYLETISRFQ